MTWHRHPAAAQIVRENWHRHEAFIVAQKRPCIRIRDDEVQKVGSNRLLVGGLPEDLDQWQRPESWFIAVVICKDDDTQVLSEYVLKHRLEPNRVHFYLHEKATTGALAAWRDAGLPLDRVSDRTTGGRPIRDWTGLHKLLGLHVNVQIVDDFLAGHLPPT